MYSGTQKKLINYAEILDSFRIIPRVLLIAYGYFCWEIFLWFKMLEDPNSQQAAFVSAVVGISGYVVKIYCQSGNDWIKTKKLNQELREGNWEGNKTE